MKPVRIQIKRTKGWRLPAGAVKVSRPSIWGNPYRVGQSITLGGETKDWVVLPFTVTNSIATVLYEHYLAANPELRQRARAELRGRDLACWCNGFEDCHADVLLRVANDDSFPAGQSHGTDKQPSPPKRRRRQSRT